MASVAGGIPWEISTAGQTAPTAQIKATKGRQDTEPAVPIARNAAINGANAVFESTPNAVCAVIEPQVTSTAVIGWMRRSATARVPMPNQKGHRQPRAALHQ